MKSEDEEEELAVAGRPVEDEEEVDEAELEAFLDGQLADRLLQEGSRQGIALENEEHTVFDIPSSKAEEALRTCKLLYFLISLPLVESCRCFSLVLFFLVNV